MSQETGHGRALRNSTLSQMASLPNSIRGPMWIIVGALFHTLTATLIKLLGDRVPVAEILVFRQTIMLMAILPFIRGNFPQALTTHHPWHHAFRITMALISMFAGFTAFVHLPLADATALGFSRSFFITIFAIIFLKEVVGIHRWAATIIGFVGVLIMLNPTGASINYYGLLAVVNAAAAGLGMVLIRSISRFDRPITILFYQTVFVGLFAAPIAFFFWVPPTIEELFILLAIGIVSIIAHASSTLAFCASNAALAAPFDYTRLIWAALIGMMIFGEIPASTTIAGASIMIMALFYTIHRETRRTTSTG